MSATRILLIAALAAAGAARLSAHHSLVAYETASLVPLSGVIERVEVMNPHVKVTLTAKDAAGNVAQWTIEMAPPGVLTRRNFDLRLLDVDRQVTIESWLRKDGQKEATGRTLVLPDGRRFDIGDSLNWSKAP